MADHVITYLGSRSLGVGSNHIAVVAVVRNEALRLPYFLTYYRKIGVDRFFFLDNGSSDGTVELLLSQSDARVFSVEGSYAESQYGVAWVNAFVDDYLDNRWLLVVDADEFLIWPGREDSVLRELTDVLDKIGAQSFCTILLDMYSDKPFGKIGYTAGADPLSFTPFFDSRPYRVAPGSTFPFHLIYGGVRERVVRSLSRDEVCGPTISKVPLVRWRKGQRFTSSTHELSRPMEMAAARGALLHFKMFDDLPLKCEREVERKQHFNGAQEYKMLLDGIQSSGSGSFFDPTLSQRYEGREQLTALGLMSVKSTFGGLPR